MSDVSTGFAPYAYSVVHQSCAGPALSLAHELGHNMGLRHDWFSDAGQTPFTYAHGHAWMNASAASLHTIMGTDELCVALGASSCYRVALWSDPGRSYDGVPLGVPAGTDTSCTAGNTLNPPVTRTTTGR